MYVMKTYGTLFDSRCEGMFLRSFDPEHNGIGAAEWCSDPADAMKFEAAIDGFELWRTQSVTTPLRDDGKPNRPLTAHTIEMVQL